MPVANVGIQPETLPSGVEAVNIPDTTIAEWVLSRGLPMNERVITRLFPEQTKQRRAILNAEGLTDWRLRTGEPYCWIKQKVIQVYPNTDLVGFLHEVAHALVPKAERFGRGQHFHGRGWGDMFSKLVRKYMIPR